MRGEGRSLTKQKWFSFLFFLFLVMNGMRRRLRTGETKELIKLGVIFFGKEKMVCDPNRRGQVMVPHHRPLPPTCPRTMPHHSISATPEHRGPSDAKGCLIGGGYVVREKFCRPVGPYVGDEYWPPFLLQWRFLLQWHLVLKGDTYFVLKQGRRFHNFLLATAITTSYVAGVKGSAGPQVPLEGI